MKTLNVLCNKSTLTPLSEVLETQETKWWRVNDETMSEVDRVVIWDEETSSKVVGKITETTYVDEPHKGWVIEFNPTPLRDGSLTRRVRWENRPKFNMIGYAITD